MLTLLQKLLRLVPRHRPDLHFVLVTRVGCHLCDDALARLRQMQATYFFALQTLDVDASPEMANQYGEYVPVVLVNGKVRFRGRINPVLLKRILDAPA